MRLLLAWAALAAAGKTSIQRTNAAGKSFYRRMGADIPDTRDASNQPWYQLWRTDRAQNDAKRWAALDDHARAEAWVEYSARLANAKDAGLPPTALARRRPRRPDRKLFVIVTTQRAGSTWLAEELDKHPCVRCALELFLEPKLNGSLVAQWTSRAMFATISGLVNGNLLAGDSVAVDGQARGEHFRQRCIKVDAPRRRLIGRQRKRIAEKRAAARQKRKAAKAREVEAAGKRAYADLLAAREAERRSGNATRTVVPDEATFLAGWRKPAPAAAGKAAANATAAN
eukprot:CAMPEP_0119290808 /NCGR_PEP_ID=MMETSP1329-20130426/41359_1 /TAXON_ID=114041 /ORGANISM="Genus nov. species nov., Strain RCC1024" /LENGTH=284 /DNA_ID=CAMNT_0007291627 /DNA_START=14 /DNA_END=865 /DNA_ORIENTATION=+